MEDSVTNHASPTAGAQMQSTDGAELGGPIAPLCKSLFPVPAGRVQRDRGSYKRIHRSVVGIIGLAIISVSLAACGGGGTKAAVKPSAPAKTVTKNAPTTATTVPLPVPTLPTPLAVCSVAVAPPCTPTTTTTAPMTPQTKFLTDICNAPGTNLCSPNDGGNAFVNIGEGYCTEASLGESQLQMALQASLQNADAVLTTVDIGDMFTDAIADLCPQYLPIYNQVAASTTPPS